MGRPEQEVAVYEVDKRDKPALWKAQQAFVTAELLREKNRLDCAANRYYYAVLHAARHFLEYRDEKGGKWSHGELARRYVTNHDVEALKAINHAQEARNRADYTPHPVSSQKIATLLLPVANMIIRAMKKADIQKG